LPNTLIRRRSSGRVDGKDERSYRRHGVSRKIVFNAPILRDV